MSCADNHLSLKYTTIQTEKQIERSFSLERLVFFEGEALAVVVVAAAVYVEHHAPYHFLQIGMIVRQHICELEEVFIHSSRSDNEAKREAGSKLCEHGPCRVRNMQGLML